MWGASVYVWTSCNINYKELLSLEFKQKDNITTSVDYVPIIQTNTNEVNTNIKPISYTSLYDMVECMDIINDALEISILYLITVIIYTNEQISSYLAVSRKQSNYTKYEFSYLLPILFTIYFICKCIFGILIKWIIVVVIVFNANT